MRLIQLCFEQIPFFLNLLRINVFPFRPPLIPTSQRKPDIEKPLTRLAVTKLHGGHADGKPHDEWWAFADNQTALAWSSKDRSRQRSCFPLWISFGWCKMGSSNTLALINTDAKLPTFRFYAQFPPFYSPPIDRRSKGQEFML